MVRNEELIKEEQVNLSIEDVKESIDTLEEILTKVEFALDKSLEDKLIINKSDLINAINKYKTDIAKKVFNDIENAILTDYQQAGSEKYIVSFYLEELDKVKRKYLNEDFFVKMTHTCPHIIPDLVTSISGEPAPKPLNLEQVRRTGVERILKTKK